MLKRIDEKLIKLAKKLIQISAFFGISRRKLLVSWVYIATVITVWGIRWEESFAAQLITAILIGAILARIFYLEEALRHYREDDVLSYDEIMLSYSQRLFLIVFYFAISYQTIFTGKGEIQGWLLLAKIMNLFFWPYICLNQDHRCKMTAKDWLNAAVKALKPKPIFQPSPQPVPVRNFQTRV